MHCGGFCTPRPASRAPAPALPDTDGLASLSATKAAPQVDVGCHIPDLWQDRSGPSRRPISVLAREWGVGGGVLSVF